MSKAFDEIAREASQLSREQRLNLASMLLELNEDLGEEEASVVWEEEILARIRAVDENEAEGVSFEAVMRDAEKPPHLMRISSCLPSRHPTIVTP